MRRALIVDDHAENLYLLTAVLGASGYKVECAANGQEALACASARPPHLIVSDILMPVMDGFTLCRACRQHPQLASVPFVFYTATYTDPADEHLALSAGADLYLVKPMEPDAFMARIAEVVNRGALGQPHRGPAAELDDVSYLREYSSALVRKLEDKVAALEDANRSLAIKDFALTSAPSGILLVEFDTRVTYANDAATILLARSADALVGASLAALFGESARWSEAAAAIATEGRWAGELDAVGPATDRRTVIARVNTVRGSGPRPLSLMVSLEDVTEQRRMAGEVERSQRLAALSLFAAGVAHDFNNLLTGLFGNIELAMADLPAAHTARTRLQYAAVAFERARDLTDRLLTFAKGRPTATREVSPAELLRECCALSLAGSSVTCVIDADGASWTVLGDANQLSRVFTNILVNARQAMAGTGTVRVSVANHESPSDAGRFVCVTISDDGPGLSPEAQHHLFDPMFTTKLDGTGLGLATCHAIVQAHGGHIEASTTPGRGATFRVYLPAGAETKAPPNQEAAPTQAPALDRARVLVMDDERLVREIASRMLRGGGCDVASAECGEQALEMCAQAVRDGQPFDVVVLDLTVPGGMGGLEVIEHLGDVSPDARVIVSSGYGPLATEKLGRRPAALLPKPYRMHELLACVRAVLESDGT